LNKFDNHGRVYAHHRKDENTNFQDNIGKQKISSLQPDRIASLLIIGWVDIAVGTYFLVVSLFAGSLLIAIAILSSSLGCII
jgi:hypothetical protein